MGNRVTKTWDHAGVYCMGIQTFVCDGHRNRKDTAATLINTTLGVIKEFWNRRFEKKLEKKHLNVFMGRYSVEGRQICNC